MFLLLNLLPVFYQLHSPQCKLHTAYHYSPNIVGFEHSGILYPSWQQTCKDDVLETHSCRNNSIFKTKLETVFKNLELNFWFWTDV